MVMGSGDGPRHRHYEPSDNVWGKAQGIERSLPGAGPMIIYEAELMPGCCHSKEEMDRSYLWIAENRIEQNIAKTVCCRIVDFVSVKYFDKLDGVRPPKGCWCCCNCCCPPKPAAIESYDDVYMCCCMECCSCADIWACLCPCWCTRGAKVVYVPLPRVCCGLCANRTSWWSNCCSLCGIKSGVPLSYAPLMEGISTKEEADRVAKKLTQAADDYGAKMGWPARPR